MLGNCAGRIGSVGIQGRVAVRSAFVMAFLLGTASISGAQSQKGGMPKSKTPSEPTQFTPGQAKPLPAKSKPIAFYTPEGQQQIADAILTDAIETVKEDTDAHFEAGEYNFTINVCRIAVQANPRDVECFSNGGYLYWSTGQNDAAIRFLKQGLAANPDNYFMYDELGAFYFLHTKDYPTAIGYYEQAIKFKCPFFTWTALGHCYEKVNQWEKAAKTWEQAANYVGGDGIPPETARQNSGMIEYNLKRVRAELAKRQKQ